MVWVPHREHKKSEGSVNSHPSVDAPLPTKEYKVQILWFPAILIIQGVTLFMVRSLTLAVMDLYSSVGNGGKGEDALTQIGAIMSLADQIQTAVDKLNEAVADNNINVGRLKGDLTALAAQVTALQQQIVDLTTVGTQTDPELIAAVEELVIAADAVKAQADSLEPVAPVEVPAIAVEADTPQAVLADGGLLEATVSPDVPLVPAEEPVVVETVDAPPVVPVDPAAVPVPAGDLHPATPVVEVPNTTPVTVPEGATPIAAGELPPDATVVPVETGDTGITQ